MLAIQPDKKPARLTNAQSIKRSSVVKRTEANFLILHDWGSSLDLWEPINSGILLKLCESVVIDIDGKDHALAAVRIGGFVCLLAIEESRLVALEGDVKGVNVRDIIRIRVAKVGIKLSAWDLGARFLEAGFGEGMVQGTEVEVDSLALADSVDVGWHEQ